MLRSVAAGAFAAACLLAPTSHAAPDALHPLELRRAYAAQFGVEGSYVRATEGDSTATAVGPRFRFNLSLVELVRAKNLTGQTTGLILQDWCSFGLGFGALSHSNVTNDDKAWLAYEIDLAVRVLAPFDETTELFVVPGVRLVGDTSRKLVRKTHPNIPAGVVEYFLAGGLRRDQVFLEGGVARGSDDWAGPRRHWALFGTLAYRLSRQGVLQYVGLQGEIRRGDRPGGADQVEARLVIGVW
ncbi:MAG: hypothetical protein HYV09_19290 [Deltaproteobacteria bacterium]|nr:hypothetical protein [Deltaproteobacteria bacterium]